MTLQFLEVSFLFFNLKKKSPSAFSLVFQTHLWEFYRNPALALPLKFVAKGSQGLNSGLSNKFNLQYQWCKDLKSKRLVAFSALEENLEGLEQSSAPSTLRDGRATGHLHASCNPPSVMRNSRTKQSQPLLSSDKASVGLVIPSLNVI